MAGFVNKGSLNYQREKREFLDGLRHFHANRGTPFERVPRIGAHEVDLYFLYQKVTSLGGLKKVSDNQGWNGILKEFSYPNACLNAEQSLKYIYIRFLKVFEQINFLGEDPKASERRDDDGPIRKKLCGTQVQVPLSYNAAQHEIARNLRAGYGLSTSYSKISDYDKLEKALLSGLPNEVDFVINVCTLLSNESKHTLRLDKCTILTELLLGHIGVFQEGPGSLERLYENEWRKQSDRDFIRFWYDTVDDEDARSLLGCKRNDCRRNLAGRGILTLGRDLGVKDKEGIRITQVAIILRNLSFEENNMKHLANSDLVFKFLLLCTYCNYGTLRQLALDTIGNLSAQFILDPVDSFKSKTILNFLVQCITAKDKFSVVTGLEMVSKLSRQEENEFVLSEKLDLYIYEEIAKYLTIQDIQLIVSSLEAMYQLSELGEETNSKIAEVSNSVDTLVSLITVEAQSYGPNSLVGIKVVEYCPPSQLTGAAKEGMPGGVGPPNSGQSSQQKQENQNNKKGDQQQSNKTNLPKPPPSSSAMEITTCNWLQATFEQKAGCVVSHIPVYSEYLNFCKKFQLSDALSSQNFQKALKDVFPRTKNVIHAESEGSRQMCIEGISRRDSQLPFSIAGQVSRPRSVAPSTSVSTIKSANSAIHSPNLIQRLASPPTRPNPTVYPTGVPVQPVGVAVSAPGVTVRPLGTVTIPTYTVSGGIPAKGTVTEAQQTTTQINTTSATTPVNAIKMKVGSKKKSSKKNAPILPRPEKRIGNLPNIVPKLAQVTTPQPQQPQLVQNIQYATYPQDIVYQSVDAPNSEAKVMVKTLLAQKIRHGNVIIQQPIQSVVNVDVGGSGEGQAVQYQNVQQTTYIQYATPGNTSQAAVQAIFQPQTSQVQTFVVQPGDVYVPNAVQSSLGTQMVTQQQLVVNPQQQIITQQPFIAPQQMIPQTAIIQQPQIVPQPQVITNTAQFQVAQQQNLHLPSSSALSTSSFMALSNSNQDVVNNGNVMVTSASQSNVHSSGQISELTHGNVTGSQNMPCSISDMNGSSSTTNFSGDAINEGDQLHDKDPVKPLSDLTEGNIESNEDTNDVGSKMDVSFEEAEIECAVGSIMEESSENVDTDEPVMIENDGNELMFEHKYQPMKLGDNGQEMYNEDEATAAVDGLVKDASCEMSDGLGSDATCKQNDVNLQNGYCNDNVGGMNGKKLNDGNEEIGDDLKQDSDAEIIAKFRAETPIVVPLISENGVFEQDFEARMAVENLLKDVEFHVTGDDAMSEENVKLVYSQPENPGSVQTVSSLCDTENLCEDSRDSVTSESQNSTKTTPLTQNGVSVSSISSSTYVTSSTSSSLPPLVSAKSSQNNNHVNHNGIISENRPLVNGNVSSPEHSVPSPSGLDNDEATSLVNGIFSDEDIKSDISKPMDKITKMNGIVNHTKTVSKVLEVASEDIAQVNVTSVKLDTTVSNTETKTDKTQDILAQSIIDTGISKSPEDSLDQAIGEIKTDNCKANTSDILAQSILENDIQPSDCDIPDTAPASVTAVVKQIIPSSVYGNIMTVQINNNTIPITFTNSPLITSSKTTSNQINVCNSRHIPTPDASRDNELSCDSTTSSITTSDLNIVVSEKHSSALSSQAKLGLKDGNKSQTSPRTVEPKKSKAKKRSRSKSGGSGSTDSRPSSVTSPATNTAPVPEYMCEWSQCRQCFDNAKSVFCHVCSVHLKTEYDGLCKWEGCESLVRKRWSLFTHVQDHHCSETSLRLASQRRLQAFQSGQQVPAPTIPAMVYPTDAATQAIRRFLPKAPYPEFLEGREGPVTKHIRLTSALILRNLAKYSPAGRSLLKKHERVISYTCMSAVESSTALANCLYEILQDQH